MEHLVHFLCAPLEVFGVLSHFETGNSHTTGVYSLTGSVGNLGCDERVDSLGGATHVGNLGNHGHLVCDKLLCICLAELVLGSAGKSDVHLLLPGLFACEELRSGEFVGVGSHDIVAGRAEFEHVVDFLGVETCGIVDISVGTGDGHNLTAKLGSLCSGTPCHVAEAGDCDCLANDGCLEVLHHLLYEVESAETGSLGTDTATAECETLACECTCVFAGELLVHTVHVAYLAAAYAYIAGGNVTVGTEIAPEFKDERLTETHDFGVALAAGAEVGTTLASTHRESGESVLESLLEAEELED